MVTVAPGLFDTPPMQGASAGAARLARHAGAAPGRGSAIPREFAALVAHIVANPMLNGEVIRLDGAIRMAPR